MAMVDDEIPVGLRTALRAGRVDMSNGKSGETVRFVLGLVLAGLIAYFTALSTLQTGLAVINEREQNHFNECKSAIDDLKSEIRLLRNRQ